MKSVRRNAVVVAATALAIGLGAGAIEAQGSPNGSCPGKDFQLVSAALFGDGGAKVDQNSDGLVCLRDIPGEHAFFGIIVDNAAHD